MTYQRAIFLLAGMMIFLSVGLTHFLHANFVYFTLFIGLNMTQFAFSNFCPASWFFQKMGVKSECDNVKQ
jgi:hypothetical protein